MFSFFRHPGYKKVSEYRVLVDTGVGDFPANDRGVGLYTTQAGNGTADLLR
jgi:hypothetical protein